MRRRHPKRTNVGRLPSTPQKMRLDGLIKDGIWYCNCDPREEAAHLQVKKKNRNHGKFFRTCKARKCDFFLWDEAAAARESGGTTATELDDGNPTRPPPSTPHKQQAYLSHFGFRPPDEPELDPFSLDGSSRAAVATDDRLSTPSIRGQASEAAQSATGTPWLTARLPHRLLGEKRKRAPDFGDSDDLLEDLSSGEEREMTAAMERSSRKLAAAHGPAGAVPSTPVRRAGGLDGGLLTPETLGAARDVSKQWDAFAAGSGNQPALPDGSTATTVTPPALLGGPLAGPLTSSSANNSFSADQNPDGDYDITAEVMSLLEGQPVGDLAKEQVREALNAYALKVRGIARGRDMVRSTLRMKDERITQLQERVAVLESRQGSRGAKGRNWPERDDG